jgi:predicted nucleic acid-binding Zn ribbon protein
VYEALADAPGMDRQMSNLGPKRRGPKPVADILGELFAARGFGRLRAQGELEDAWNAAVGEPGCKQTRLGEVRRGVLIVTVAHPALLEELAAFEKPRLLAALRQNAPGTVVHDIRFRIGPVNPAPNPNPGPGPTGGTGGAPRPRRPPGGGTPAGD